MSSNLINEEKKYLNNNLNGGIQNNNIKQERSDENVFKKAENIKNITTYGLGAKVLYVNNKRIKDDKFPISTNDFISDGGLKEKLSKYNSSINLNNNGNIFNFSKKGTSLATNYPIESNYQQLSTNNVDIKVNDKARINSADNLNLEAIANRRIYSIMDKKSSELIRHDTKQMKKLEGLHDKNVKTLKDQKSKSSSNLSKEKTLLKAKERERDNKEEKKILHNNFFEIPKNSKINANKVKKEVVYSKKGEYNSNQDKNNLALKFNEDMNNDEILEQNETPSHIYQDKNDNYQDLGNFASDNDNENMNIEQTKRQNYEFNDANNQFKQKVKPRSLPKDSYEIKQELKIKKNNYLENQKKFSAMLKEENIKKMKEQQVNRIGKNDSDDNNYVVNKEINMIKPTKPINLKRNNLNNNTNNNNNNLNQNFNKSSITNTNERPNQINKILSTEEKIENLEKQHECFERSEIKKVEKEGMEKIKKNFSIQRKLKYIQEKGIGLNFDENSEHAEEEAQKIENSKFNENSNNTNNKEEEEKNYVFHESDNNFFEKENNNNIVNNHQANNFSNNKDAGKFHFENISKIKKSNLQSNYSNNNQMQQQLPKKIKVDSLEYLKRIEENRKKFVSKSPEKSEILNRSDSFRRSYSENNNNQHNNNNQKIIGKNKSEKYKIDINELEDNEEEEEKLSLLNKLYLKNNSSGEDKKRNHLEIKQFMERKRKEKKKIELKEKEVKDKIRENKFIQLFNLEKNIKNENNFINKKSNNNSSSQNCSRQSNSGNKVRNDFYIGNKKPSTSNLDESSILDPDDFYYTVLESKNIIETQSHVSNKINSVSVKNSNKSTKNDIIHNYNTNFKTSDEFQKQNAVSRLSDFTQGNYKDIRKYDYNISTTDKKVSNKMSQENFLKFLTENEKITLRSLDSKNSNNNINDNSDIKNAYKNYLNSNNFNNTSNFNTNNNNYLNNVNNKDNINYSSTNLKLTTDSKLIGSKSSNFNAGLGRTDNFFENNLENNAKVKHDNIHSQEQKSPEFEAKIPIKVENENLQKDKLRLKETEISNVSGSASEKVINRSEIEKDSFFLQLDNTFAVFCTKLKNVFLKKHLAELINNIIMREQIKYYQQILSNLCNIGKRNVFERIKEYANAAHIENIYSVFNNLTLFAKRNAMKSIFQYFAFVRNLESENNAESELGEYENLDTKKLEEIQMQYLSYFVGILDRLFLIQKKEAIEKIAEYAKNFSLYNDLHLDKQDISNNNINNKIVLTKSSFNEDQEEIEYSEEKIAQYYEYIKSAFDLMTKHIKREGYYRIMAYAESRNNQKINESQRSWQTSNNNDSSLKSERNREKIVLRKKSANGESFSSVFNQNKANSFIAQSHNSSNFSLHPNSLDSPKIRKLHFKIAQKNLEREWLENIDEKYGNSNNNNNKNNSENKSVSSYSNNNLNINNNNYKDNNNLIARSDDEIDESKNINYSKLSLDDYFKDSKKGDKKFFDPNKNNDENSSKANNKLIEENKKIFDNANEDKDQSIISINKNNSISINLNKYSTVNYNDELNLNLGPTNLDLEKKKSSSEQLPIQHNNRYNSSYNDSNANELSFNSGSSKNKKANNANLINASPIKEIADIGIKKEFSDCAKTKKSDKPNIFIDSNFDNYKNATKNLNNTPTSKEKRELIDPAGNLKSENITTENIRGEKSIHEEIAEDIPEENYDISSNRKRNSRKDSSGKIIATDIDISADRDNVSDIDWIYTVSQSKSGSLREISGNNLVKQFSDLTSKTEENKIATQNINLNANKEKDDIDKKLRTSASMCSEGDKRSEKDFDLHKKSEEFETLKKKEEIKNKIKETLIEPVKNTEEDYENNYDDFDNIEEDINIDEEPDFAKIIGEDSTSNLHHGSLSQNLIKSRNSINKNNLQEEKDSDEINKKNINLLNGEDLKNKGFTKNKDEKEIDLTNKNINLNVIPGKDTIESVKDIKSIESDDNDFFKIKNNNNQNILTLLDDKSSNNKSVNVMSFNSPDLNLISDRTSSYNLQDIQLNKETITTDYLGLDKKSENTVSTLNKKSENKENLNKNNNINNIHNNTNEKASAVNKRYESIENSAKKSEQQIEKEYLSLAEMETLSSELAEKILNDLIEAEVKEKSKILIPKKIFKSEAGLLNMLNTLNTNPLNRSTLSIDSSMSSNINNTLFSKSVLEQKKENSMKLYIEQIGPKLIDNIVEEINNNFDSICKNLNMPYKSDSKEVIISMSLRDRNRLKQSYKFLEKPDNAKKFINKKKVLDNFEIINKNIREDDNIISDNYYDNILNECLIDAANELLEKERIYGEIGEPLTWSSRTRITKNKISANEITKNKISQNVQKDLTQMINYRMGMITENYDYLEPDQINQEREKRSINHINKELNEVEEIWKNYEFEETQVKLELSELVLEQLLNEIVEILEHIYVSRKKPDLYQYKSIYACEDIPRLSFQQTNTDMDLDNINQ